MMVMPAPKIEIGIFLILGYICGVSKKILLEIVRILIPSHFVGSKTRLISRQNVPVIFSNPKPSLGLNMP